MTRPDPRVDAYIARAEPFARPILQRLRAVVHEACPEVQEAIKWGFPHFLYHGNLAFMASFKAHCGFGFWRGQGVTGAPGRQGEAMGQYGRLTALSDLPSRAVLTRHVREAMKLNEAPPPRKPATRRPPPRTPADLAAAIGKAPKAAATFKALSSGNRREYVDWITGAKRAETRRRRIDTAIAWLSEGKRRNWKYERSR